MKTTIDIVIPVYNEEQLLELNIIKVMGYLNKELNHKYKCRVIIADNGSDDRTPSISKKLVQQFEGDVVYQRISQKGVGLALKTTWSESTAEYVGYMDLDLATELNHLPEAFDALLHKDVDIVYGTRLHKNSLVIGRTIKREITSRLFNLIVKLFLRTRFSDGMCGFKFLKQQYISSIIERGATSNGWFFCTEILVVSEWMGLKLHELPVKWTDDPNSKVNIIKLAKEYIYAIFKLKKKKYKK